MPIYNIIDQVASTNLEALWHTGNLRTNLYINFLSKSTQEALCNNFFTNNSNFCDVKQPNDRFSAYSFLKSSKLDTLSNNNNSIDIFANFINSYEQKISPAKHYKPIKN